MTTNARILQEIDFADHDSARLRQIITQARNMETALTARDLGMLEGDRYREALAHEHSACMKIDDELSIVEVDLDRELTNAEELRLYEELLELRRPGDLIAKTNTTTYQVAAPWHGTHEAEILMGYVAGAVAEAVPDLEARIGCATYPGATMDEPIALAPIGNRTPVVKMGRARR
jgi:hypothetical protein